MNWRIFNWYVVCLQDPTQTQNPNSPLWHVHIPFCPQAVPVYQDNVEDCTSGVCRCRVSPPVPRTPPYSQANVTVRSPLLTLWGETGWHARRAAVPLLGFGPSVMILIPRPGDFCLPSLTHYHVLPSWLGFTGETKFGAKTYREGGGPTPEHLRWTQKVARLSLFVVWSHCRKLRF